jgi:glycosyltransferase involved in cell wall biosynthesis
MNFNPLVSVIIPAFNAENFIAETLNSVKGQTYSSWECIVVDDGSMDQTRNIIENFENQDNRFHYIKGQHGGVSRARNSGISLARGDYIALLDHDDIWAPTKLEKQMAIFARNPELGLVYSDAFIQTQQKAFRHSDNNKLYRGDIFFQLIRNNFIICQTVILSKKLISERKNPFIPELEMAEEFELFLWIAARSKIDYVNEPLSTYIIHGRNDSLKRYEIILNELLIIHENLKNDPIVQSFPKFKRALSSILRLREHEKILLKWKNGRVGVLDLFKFIRGCYLKREWSFIFAMPFMPFATYESFSFRLKKQFLLKSAKLVASKLKLFTTKKNTSII